jgi:hypothetical protein
MRLLFALVCLSVPLVVEAQQGPPKKIASVEGVTEYRLANGARVLLFPERTKPTVTVNMTVMVGSRHEGYGEAGMAHLLEHMVFKGTPTFPDVPTALRDHGASFNGTTNRDRTNYYETLPADDSNLEFAIKLEADRLVNEGDFDEQQQEIADAGMFYSNLAWFHFLWPLLLNATDELQLRLNRPIQNMHTALRGGRNHRTWYPNTLQYPDARDVVLVIEWVAMNHLKGLDDHDLDWPCEDGRFQGTDGRPVLTTTNCTKSTNGAQTKTT